MSSKPKTTSAEDLARIPNISTEYMKAWTALALCTNCGRRTRPRGTSERDWPATVGGGSNGVCQPCYLSGRRTATTHNRQRGEFVSAGIPLAEIASGWTEDQHAIAFLVCGRVESASEAGEILAMLGLFSTSDSGVADPDSDHTIWFGRF